MVSNNRFRSTVSLLLVAGFIGILGGCAAQQETVDEGPQQEEQVEQETEQEVQEETETSETAEAEATVQPGMPDDVRSYVRMASEDYTMPEGDEKYDHHYTAERFRSLARALEASAGAWELETGQREQIESLGERLREVAGTIQAKRIAPHSKDIHSGMQAGGAALDYFTDRKEGLESVRGAMMDKAEAFDTDVPFLKQPFKVEAYFKKTARFFEILYG